MTAAWVLDFGSGLRAAVGEQHQVHLAYQPQDVFELPLTPRHARHAILWNDMCVPVLDLGAWLTQGSASTEQHTLGVYWVPGRPGDSMRFGALWLAKPPQRRLVDDSMAADLPAMPQRWAQISCSCFTDAAGAVPVLDLALVFAEPSGQPAVAVAQHSVVALAEPA
ncbi:MAG: hypothetical protein WA210_22745 [Burkholderiaceae bacterium]